MVLYYLKSMNTNYVQQQIIKLESIISAYLTKHNLKSYEFYIDKVKLYIRSPFTQVYYPNTGDY
jgi:hypothetical protein